MDQSLCVEERDDRVVVTLDRPDVRSATDAAMVAGLLESEEEQRRGTAFLDRSGSRRSGS